MANYDIYDFVFYVRNKWITLDCLMENVTEDNIKEIEKIKTKDKIMLYVALGNLEKIKDYTPDDYEKCVSNYDDPLLFLAAWYNHIHILEYFWELGMDFYKKNNGGDSVYAIALAKNRIDVIKFLEDKCSSTLLKYFYKTPKILLNIQYYYDIYKINGMTCFDYLQQRSHKWFKRIIQTIDLTDENFAFYNCQYTLTNDDENFWEQTIIMSIDRFFKTKKEKYLLKSLDNNDRSCVICDNIINDNDYIECIMEDVCHYDCYVDRFKIYEKNDKISLVDCVNSNVFNFRCPSCCSKFTNKTKNDSCHIVI